MIDPQDLRERPDEYQRACDVKGIKCSVAELLRLDTEYRALKTATESSRAEQNRLSKALPKLPPEEKQQALATLKQLSGAVKQKNEELRRVEVSWREGMLRLPSVPSPECPEGKDDSENVELYLNGEPPTFSFPMRDHVELGKLHGMIDIERGAKVAGARNYYLLGDGALLQQAVQIYALDFLTKRGYTPVAPPHLVKYESMMGTGYFPGGEEAAYSLDERDPDTFLIGTSEVPICAFHLHEMLERERLPLKYAGVSPCYRREAGTYGKDTHGLYRVHQFFKVEQVVICEASVEESKARHAELLQNAEDFIQSLELPYRVVAVCTGDMGQGQVYKNDIECWMPSRNAYGETHSCSTFHDFQSRRLKMRYKNSEGESTYCHTLNNTLVASPRVLIPLLEVHQQADGRVTIPEVLRPYLGGRRALIPAELKQRQAIAAGG